MADELKFTYDAYLKPMGEGIVSDDRQKSFDTPFDIWKLLKVFGIVLLFNQVSKL